MKALQKTFYAALSMMLLLVVNVSAQQTTAYAHSAFDLVTVDKPVMGDAEEDFPRVSEYVDMPFADWNTNWWMSLEQEISLEEQSYRSLSGEALQNAIFFLANHGERVDLTSSAPVLLDVYLFNKSEEKRIMALAALTLINDQASLDTAERLLYRQRSERVKDFSIAALTAHKAGQMTVKLASVDK